MNIYNLRLSFRIGLIALVVILISSFLSAMTVTDGYDESLQTCKESTTDTTSTDTETITEPAIGLTPDTTAVDTELEETTDGPVETSTSVDTEPEDTTIAYTEDTESLESDAPQGIITYENYINLTDDEIYTLATLVYLEAGIESFECQKAIASVVINRMTTRNQTLNEVIYAPNQFTPAGLIIYNSPTDSTLAAVQDVVKNGPNIPEYVTFFREGYFFSWAIDYVKYDHTCFSYTQAVYDLVMSR